MTLDFGNKIKLMLELPSLQFFAAGDNNDLAPRRYERRFKDALQTVFNKQSYFADFSAGGIEALDGVQENATAFTIKTSDIPVVVGTYNTGATVAFGAGTSNTNRFGNRTEIIYVNTDVPYTATWSIHEGIDRHTVNNEMQTAEADRLVLQAQAKARLIDNSVAVHLNTVAGNTEVLTAMTEAGVNALFDELSVYYTDIEVSGTKLAKVTPALYNAIIANKLTVKEKGSSINIDTDYVYSFKDFVIQKVPTNKMPAGTVALVYVPGIGKTFTGISTTRSIESEDFDGRALQGAGKYGNFTLNDNKKAVTKVTFTPGP